MVFLLTLRIRVIRSSLISHLFTRVISFSFFYLLTVNLHGNEDSLQEFAVLLHLRQTIIWTLWLPLWSLCCSLLIF
ncbi:hypothetical protein V8C26DRAFT_343388 [Trichoderma gracile]